MARIEQKIQVFNTLDGPLEELIKSIGADGWLIMQIVFLGYYPIGDRQGINLLLLCSRTV